MQELLFELIYDEGADPLMDVFDEYSELTASSISSCVDRDCCWIVDRFAGPSSALDRIEAVRCDEEGPDEEMTKTDCNASRQVSVLQRSSSSLTTYTFLESLHTCDSIYALAARRLEPGVVIQSRRRNRCQEFRLLVRSKENVEVFYDRFRELLREGISVQFGHLGSVEQWAYESLTGVSLSDEQRLTLETAVEQGYYETPREITLAELADRMDIPRSTVSYRLRRAEAKFAKGYLREFTAAIPN